MAERTVVWTDTATQLIITAYWDNRQDPKKLLELIQKQK